MRNFIPPLLLLMACSTDKDVATDSGVVIDTGENLEECIPETEVCNGIDDDCDGDVDEEAEDASTWYPDEDGDGFGQDSTTTIACEAPENTSLLDGDCDDTNANVHPEADELCNHADDNCDGEIDNDVIDPELSYIDLDEDGYGDPSTELSRCPVDDERVTNGDDCNDTDASIHPNAEEICNGIDDDCDASSDEEGTALWHPSDGGASESWTDILSAGSATEATVIVIEEPGRLDVCVGEWESTFRVRADFELVGMGDSPDEVVFNGTGLQGVVIARTDTGANVSLQNVSLTQGQGVGAILGELTAGGGIECVGDRLLTLNQVVLSKNQADVGAGLYVQGCTVQGDGLIIHENTANHYGGGIAILSGDVQLDNSDVHDNLADFGGGVALVDLDGTSPFLSLDSARLISNRALFQGGGAVLEGGSMSCTNGGVFRNWASEGGGVLLDFGSELISDSCDWGPSGTSDDNDPSDIRVLFDDYDDYGSAETFRCDEEGCQ